MLLFTGARGQELAGRLDLPDGKPRAVVLIAHCFGNGNVGAAADQVARSFTGQGMAVLSLDFGRPGHSDERLTAGSSLGVDDLASAADHLRATIGAPSILVGHSLGGAAVLAIAARVPETRAVVTLAAPADATRLADLEQIGVQAQLQRIAALRRALLVMHAPGDQVVDVDNAQIIFEAARHPKSFVSLDDADHRLTRPADAAYAASVMGRVGFALPARTRWPRQRDIARMATPP
jgi:uncharacterized protein